MSIKVQLQDDLKDAMRSKDEVRKRTTRLALASIKLAEVDKGELDEADELAIIQKEIKQRQETIEDARRSGHSELIEENQAEIGILMEYLPKQLTNTELEEMARQAVEEVGATDMSGMGQVMKVLVPRLAGRATGQQASQAVRKLLA